MGKDLMGIDLMGNDFIGKLPFSSGSRSFDAERRASRVPA
jgi:hypothetical protein